MIGSLAWLRVRVCRAVCVCGALKQMDQALDTPSAAQPLGFEDLAPIGGLGHGLPAILRLGAWWSGPFLLVPRR